MKIAIISDIHGNLVALDAVLADIERARPDQIVCLGDIVVLGPQPREALARVRSLACPVVMGNTDEWLFEPRPYPIRNDDSTNMNDIELWCARQLAPDDLAFVRTFQPTVELSLDEGTTLLCCHGSPNSYNDKIVATTPDDELERMLSGFHTAIIAGGHTHTPLLRRHKDMLFINPGSVGLPFEFQAETGEVRNPPWAEYALVTSDNGTLSVELRRVPVDIQTLVKVVEQSSMPHVEWWIKKWVSA
jgi:putative phosphoesterase